jgi:hypothetical protein
MPQYLKLSIVQKGMYLTEQDRPALQEIGSFILGRFVYVWKGRTPSTNKGSTGMRNC